MRFATRGIPAGLLALCASLQLAAVPGQPGVPEQEAYAIGVEAYHYLYPLISLEITRRVSTNFPAGMKAGYGPVNAFQHTRTFPEAEFREVARPNFDVLHSTAWLDLTKEPVIVSVPDTGGRYYVLPMLDMWSDVFAVPGKRTSGTSAQAFALVPRGWNGTLPNGVQRIDSPTSYVWVIGRTQTDGPKDYPAVHKIQDGYTVTPLSRWGKTGVTLARFDPAVDMKTTPLAQVNTMPAAEYFALGAQLMGPNPPHLTDWSTIARLKRIGLEPGKAFDLGRAPPAVRAGLERAAVDGLLQMKEGITELGTAVNGWQAMTDSVGVYGNNYFKRAVVAMIRLGANPPDETVHSLSVTDADGKPLAGEGRYVIHFGKDELPPVEALWSITMYDGEGFQVANPIDRFAIGDRHALEHNPDGSLDLYLQHDSPGSGRESNWLPSPASGVFELTMRLYAPKPQALDGRWAPPRIKRVR